MTTLNKKGMLGIITSIALAAVVFSVALPYQESQAGAPVNVCAEGEVRMDCKLGEPSSGQGPHSAELYVDPDGDGPEERQGLAFCQGNEERMGLSQVLAESCSPQDMIFSLECDTDGDGQVDKIKETNSRVSKAGQVHAKGACHDKGGLKAFFEFFGITIFS